MALATMPPSSPGDRGPRDLSRVGWCLLIVLGLHVSLLAIPARSAAPRTEAAASVRAVHVRTLQMAALSGAPESPAAMRASHSSAQESVTVDAIPHLTGKLAVEPDAAPTLADGAGTAPTLPDLGLYAWSAEPVDDYYPRTELTVGPTPAGVVQIEYPAVDGERDLYVSELVLLIDETGVVSRVLLVGAPLPAQLEEAARSAFLHALFMPGERDGRAVKSRIRVEVVFDNRRIAP
jgi:periplasmic protein TonB